MIQLNNRNIVNFQCYVFFPMFYCCNPYLFSSMSFFCLHSNSYLCQSWNLSQSIYYFTITPTHSALVEAMRHELITATATEVTPLLV